MTKRRKVNPGKVPQAAGRSTTPASSRKDAAPGSQEGLRARAEAIVGAGGAPGTGCREVVSREEVQRLVHDLEVHQVELQMQNEELRRAQDELEASRARYFDLYELAPAGCVTLDEDGLVLEANLAAAGLLGVSRGTLVRKPLTRFIVAEGQQTFSFHFTQLFQTGVSQAFELEMARESAAPFTAWVVMSTDRAAVGRPVSRVVLSDISERKRVEEALRRSEANLRKAERIARVGNWEWNIVTNELAWSDEVYRLYGMDPLKGKPSFDVVVQTLAPECRERFVAAVEDAVQHGKSFEGEYRMISLDGTVHHTHTIGEVVRDPAGRPLSMFGVVQDVTENKRAREELRESREQFALILDSAAEGIYGVDLAGNCTFCNPAALRLLGYRERGELLGRTVHDCVHHTKIDGSPYPREECLVSRAMATGDAVHSDRECFWRPDGGSFPAEFWVHPLRRDGETVGAVVTFVDRTEHVALERQRLQNQKLEAVGQLAAGVAHDFNNIISAIIGHGHLVLTKLAEDDPARLNVESQLQASYQASRLVQSLLTVGRQQMTDRRPADIATVVGHALRRVAQTLGPGVELKTAIAGEPLPVLVDAGQIETVLQNLAANAVAAMPRGGVLTVATQRVAIAEGFIAAHGFGRPGPCVLLSVSDTGAGMDEQTRRRVFEPFFSTKEAGPNAGLGLAVVYGIVKQHDGHIVVDSRKGAGARFDIYLPLLEAPG